MYGEVCNNTFVAIYIWRMKQLACNSWVDGSRRTISYAPLEPFTIADVSNIIPFFNVSHILVFKSLFQSSKGRAIDVMVSEVEVLGIVNCFLLVAWQFLTSGL